MFEQTRQAFPYENSTNCQTSIVYHDRSRYYESQNINLSNNGAKLWPQNSFMRDISIPSGNIKHHIWQSRQLSPVKVLCNGLVANIDTIQLEIRN